MKEEIIQEIETIDRAAEEMAASVLKYPQLRSSLEKGREDLEHRLLELADELERIDPAAYATVADQVSEAILDLAFVDMDSDMVSFRLGRLMEQQKTEDGD